MKIAFAFMEGTLPQNTGALYGQSRAVLGLAQELAALGHEVLFVGRKDPANAQWPGLECTTTSNVFEQAELIHGRNPDVIIGVSTALVFSRVHAPRNLVYHHNPSIINGIEDLGRELYSRLQGIVVVSADAKRHQTEIGVPSEKIHIVSNGIDLKVFCPSSVDRNKNRIVLVGSVTDYKGADIVLRAFRDVKTVVRDAELHVYGGNQPWQNSTDWLKLEGLLASDQTIDWNVVAAKLPGVKYCGESSSEQLAAAYRSASVLVSGSRIPETAGLVSIEAQACGCIPVLPNHGGMPETLKVNQTGLLYSPCDPGDLTDKLFQLLRPNSSLNVAQMRGDAATWVAGQFSWRRAAVEFERLVQQLPMHGWRDSVAAAYYRSGRQIRETLRLSHLRRASGSSKN